MEGVWQSVFGEKEGVGSLSVADAIEPPSTLGKPSDGEIGQSGKSLPSG